MVGLTGEVTGNNHPPPPSLPCQDNVAAYAPAADTANAGFIESNMMHTVNGMMYNGIGAERLTMTANGNVSRWYVAAMGNEEDLHTPHWHAHSVVDHGVRKDVLSVIPAEMTTVDMVADNPGNWSFHCHVNEHNRCASCVLPACFLRASCVLPGSCVLVAPVPD